MTVLPHMGWNDVLPEVNPLFSGITDLAFIFFIPILFARVCNHVIAKAQYGDFFAVAVCKDNIIGVQFHLKKVTIGVLSFSNFAQISS